MPRCTGMAATPEGSLNRLPNCAPPGPPRPPFGGWPWRAASGTGKATGHWQDLLFFFRCAGLAAGPGRAGGAAAVRAWTPPSPSPVCPGMGTLPRAVPIPIVGPAPCGPGLSTRGRHPQTRRKSGWNRALAHHAGPAPGGGGIAVCVAQGYVQHASALQGGRSS